MKGKPFDELLARDREHKPTGSLSPTLIFEISIGQQNCQTKGGGGIYGEI